MPKIKKIKTLIVLWGFNRHSVSYQKVVDLAPKGWKVYQFPYKQLMPSAKLTQLYQNLPAYIKENNLGKVYLMGHSLGGALALDFTIHCPEFVEMLFLVDSAGVYDQKPVLNGFYNTVRHSSFPPNELHKNGRELIQTMKTPLLYAKLGWYAHHIDLVDQAKKLQVPTILFWGENDRITPLWQGQKLHQAIPNSELIVFKDLGHDWIIDNPEKFWSNVVK